MKILWLLLLASLLCVAFAQYRFASKRDKDEVVVMNYEDREGNQDGRFGAYGTEKSHDAYQGEELGPLKDVESMENESANVQLDSSETDDGDDSEEQDVDDKGEQDVDGNGEQDDDDKGEQGDDDKEEQDDDNDDDEVYSQDANAQVRWQNKYHKNYTLNCGKQKGIYSVHSVFHHHYGDRLWSWECRRVSSHPYNFCHWSGNENALTGNMNFTCPSNQVLNGVYSYYIRTVNDRRWRFLCCASPRHYTTNCYTSEWTNTGQEHIYHRVGVPRVFTGATSVYNHEKKDRIWKFKVCEYTYGFHTRVGHRTAA